MATYSNLASLVVSLVMALFNAVTANAEPAENFENQFKFEPALYSAEQSQPVRREPYRLFVPLHVEYLGHDQFHLAILGTGRTYRLSNSPARFEWGFRIAEAWLMKKSPSSNYYYGSGSFFAPFVHYTSPIGKRDKLAFVLVGSGGIFAFKEPYFDFGAGFSFGIATLKAGIYRSIERHSPSQFEDYGRGSINTRDYVNPVAAGYISLSVAPAFRF